MAVQGFNRLIKANAIRHLGSGAAFNFDDLRRQCEEHVALARREGAEIVASANLEADEIRRLAFDEGRAAGQQAGLAEAHGLVESRASELADRQTQERLKALLPSLDALIESLKIEYDRWLGEWEKAAIRLSAAIAEKVVRRTVSQHGDVTGELIREALQLAAPSPQLTIRLNPLDHEQFKALGEHVTHALSSIGTASLVPDESISRGGCLIETLQGTIDARIETQIGRIVDELLGTA